MTCKVVLLVLCSIATNEAFHLRPRTPGNFFQVDKKIIKMSLLDKIDHNTSDEEVDECEDGYSAWNPGYGISGGDQGGWAPPADMSSTQELNKQNTSNDIGQFSDKEDAKSAFKRVRRDTDPKCMNGVCIKFPPQDPICKYGLPSVDMKTCCSAACWTCDAHAMCNDPKEYMSIKGQNASLCCPSMIQSVRPACEASEAPCVITRKYREKLQGGITDEKHERNKNRIKMYEFRRLLYFMAKTDYDWGETTAGNVWRASHFKVVEAWRRVNTYKKNITDAKKNRLVGSVTSSLPIWKNGIVSEREEARFYAQIRRNAIWVHQNSTQGLNKVDYMKKAIMVNADRIDEFEPKIKALHTESVRLHREADMLWKQWQDSAKTYKCVDPSVTNAKLVCTGPDTAQRYCSVTCHEGYDGEHSRNNFRCLKKGDFGKELYGELMGMAVCPGRNCGKPPAVQKANVNMQDVIFPHAAHYTCTQGYSKDGNAQGQKTLSLKCGTKGTFPQHNFMCQPIKCGIAPVVANAAGPYDKTFVYTNVLSYTCNEGYTIDGTAGGLKKFQASCLSSGRFSVTPQCLPVRCGPAPEFRHTDMVTKALGDQHFPVELAYSCKNGFSLDQKPGGDKKFTLKCYPSGEFSLKGRPGVQLSATQCRAVSAGMAPKVAHANFVSREMFYGESVTISADPGYSTEAKADSGFSFPLSVTTEGKYAGLKTFKPVECGPVPVVPNCAVPKAAANILKNAHFGDTLDYKCNDGYSVDLTPAPASAKFDVKCEADGSFSKIPGQGKCVNIDDCASHTCGPHGNCVDKLMNYSCACQSGYEETYVKELDERICGNIDDCGPEACGVGTCVDLVKDYKCNCPSGYFQQDDGEEHTCAPVLCGVPPEIAKAVTQPLAKQFEKSYYLDKILYQCATGHTLDAKVTGKHGFRIDCGADKRFSRSSSCNPIKCGSVPNVRFASKSLASAVYNQVVTYTCARGYTTDATATGDKIFRSRCLASGTFSDRQTCKRVVCGEPDDVANAHRRSGKKRFLESVEYTCFDGFTLNGHRNGKKTFSTMCRANGDFTKAKECKPKECGHAPSKIHALYASIQDEVLHYPKLAIVTCQDGFTVGGSPKGKKDFAVKCGVDGLFQTPNPKSCQAVRCGPLPKMANAAFSKMMGPDGKQTWSKTLAFGYKAYYKCRTGFTAGGEPEAAKEIHAECSGTGTYSLPNADMQCTNVNDCAGHTCGPHGTCVDQIGVAPAYTCKCDHGFDIRTKNGEKVCGNIDDCGGKSCGAGLCKDLVGDYTCICPNGYYIGFQNNAKTCIAVRCAARPPRLGNGRQLSSGSGPVDFPRTLRYKCNTGYSTDGSPRDAKKEFQAHCSANGRMSGMYSCQKMACGMPKVFAHTALVRPSQARKRTYYNDAVSYKCHRGHTIGGRTNGGTRFSVKCQASAQLSAPRVCSPIKCGSPPRYAKARAGISASIYYGMSVRYQCDKGHTLNGRANGGNIFTLTCKATRRFTGLPSSKPCKPVSAGRLRRIPNADLTEYNGRRVRGTVVAYYPAGLKYRCKSGYSLTGSSGGATSFMSHVTSMGTLVPALPSSCKAIKYSIQGEIKDARNGAGLSSTTVTIVGGGQTRTTSTRNGFFTFSNVPKGIVKMKYSKPGYIVANQQINLQSDLNNGGPADINMSPKLPTDQWRATLKWEARPTDLDTYVKWGSTKVFYGGRYRSQSGLSARLDCDKTRGFGPETATMMGIGSCRGNSYKCDIKYIIRDYTRGRTGYMPNYRAEVMLYNGNRVAGSWNLRNCPRAVSSDKIHWHVFTIDGRTNRLKWHCGMGGGATWLLNSTGLNTTNATTDFESYVGPFPGRFFRHSQHKHKAVRDTTTQTRAGKKFLH